MLTRPLRVAVLCSHRAPGLLHLLNADPDRGRTFDIVCCVTSEATYAEEVRVERRGVPTRSHGIRAFYDARKAPIGRAPEIRSAFDAETVTLLKRFAPDLILTAGYLYLLTEPMLAAFRHRILNLHFADLMLRTPDGAPGFPGIRAVRDALAAGCADTRATVHLVDAGVDAGQPLVRSWPFPVSPMVEDAAAWTATDLLRAYTFAHEQWMMRACAGPLWSAALQLVTRRTIDLDRLAASVPDTVAPWELGRRGTLMPPLMAQLALAR
ncbi:MAG TPA: formyltransferase family protein [Vicinamibacterales bacterium]|nr:formyltransferase family protein [Vicinamibacterales bacterium]